MTKIAIREARLKEIRQEILNSTKLQAHLADNPKDAKVIFNFEFLSNSLSNRSRLDILKCLSFKDFYYLT